MKLKLLSLAVLFSHTLLSAESITVYSSRHYGGDADLFGAFTRQTGIEVNVLEAKGDALLERIKHEGKNCPADVLITVDAARLGAAEQAGLFQPMVSEALTASLSEEMRHPEGLWYGLGRRVRIAVIAPDRVDTDKLSTYADLASPEFRDRIVVRSSSNVYNQSLLAALIARMGTEEAQQWAKGVLANMARNPQGNDRAQIRAVAAGEADVAIVNHYYLARMMASEDAAEKEASTKVAVHFLGQGENGGGAHVNVSGAGALKHAPNPEGAKKLLEFMASEAGQALFVKPSWEYPANPMVSITYPMFPTSFKADAVNASELADNNKKALMIFDMVGWR